MTTQDLKELFADYKLQPGYAEFSTKRRPIEPETVIVGEEECSQAECLGAIHSAAFSEPGWMVWKIPGKSRYYFQLRPW